MNRSTGTGFIGFGLALLVVGAILRFAVTASTDGFDFQMAGLVAIWVGVISTVIGLLLVILGSNRKSTVRDEVVQTPTGSERIQQRDDFTL